jgi:electron transport complex protein RnfD
MGRPAYLAGGLWLLAAKDHHLARAGSPSSAHSRCSPRASGSEPAGFAGPLFHLVSGGAMLGAFFIVTDPVSGARRRAAS